MKKLNYRLIALHLTMGLFLILSMEWIAPLFNWTFVETSITQGNEAAIRDLDYSVGELLTTHIYLEFAAIPLTFLLSFILTRIRKEGIINPIIVLVLTYLLSTLYRNSSIDVSELSIVLGQMMFDDLKSIYIFNGMLFLTAGLIFLGISGRPRRIKNIN